MLLASFMDAGGAIVPILMFGMGGAIPIVGIIAYYWHRTIVVRESTELKRMMIERGMTADEIIDVIEAGGGSAKDVQNQ